MYSVQEIGEEQERQYNQLMQEDDQYCHPESFKWGFEHGFKYALSKFGWHPASEPPEEGVKVLLLSYGATSADEVEYIKGMGYVHITSGTILRYPKARFWCYQPKEKD